MVLGSTVTLTLTLKDSAGNGIGGKTLLISSKVGNTLSSDTITTGFNGQATVIVTTTVGGGDTIMAFGAGATAIHLRGGQDLDLIHQPPGRWDDDGRASLEGAMDVRASPPQLRAKLNARNLDAGRLSRALGATERLDGQLDLNLDVAGRGGTPRALVATLNGRATASLSNGRIGNRYLEWLAADLLRALLPGGEAETAISCALGQFDIKAGVATAQALVVDTKRVVVTGSGTVTYPWTASSAFIARLGPDGYGWWPLGSGLGGPGLTLHDFDDTDDTGDDDVAP